MEEINKKTTNIVPLTHGNIVKVGKTLQITNKILTEQYSREIKSVTIGNQVWMAENLDVEYFQNGELIPEANEDDKWEMAFKQGKPAWCFYEKDPKYGKKYGKLYNRFAVEDQRGLAPKNWHIPNFQEWKLLMHTLGGSEIAGIAMKSTEGWNDFQGKSGNGTNESGFSALPGGHRSDGKIFLGIGYGGSWWGISNQSFPWNFELDWHRPTVERRSHWSEVGLSVRCIRDN